MLCKDTERLIRASRCFVKVTLAWLSKSKSAIIRWVLHRDWHLVMSQCSQDTQALLGQVTGSVTANNPAVLIEAETAGRWSACINFRGVQELAAAIVVTTATVKVSPGRACCHSCHSNVHTGGLTLFFLFFLFQQHLALLRRISNSSGMWEELTCLCRSMCERRRKHEWW